MSDQWAQGFTVIMSADQVLELIKLIVMDILLLHFTEQNNKGVTCWLSNNPKADLLFHSNMYTDFLTHDSVIKWKFSMEGRICNVVWKIFRGGSYLCVCGCGRAAAMAWRKPFHRWCTHMARCVSECASSEPQGWCTLWGNVCRGKLAWLLWQGPPSPPLPQGGWCEAWPRCISSSDGGHMCVRVQGWGDLRCVLHLPLHNCWHCCWGWRGSWGPGGPGWQRALFGRWVGRGWEGHSGPTPDLLWSRWQQRCCPLMGAQQEDTSPVKCLRQGRGRFKHSASTQTLQWHFNEL